MLSFYERTYEGALRWVGPGNYVWLFSRDPYGGLILWNTLLYSVTTPAISIVLALPIAATLKRLGGGWLVLIMLPAFIPPVTATMAWYLMLNPFYGLWYYLMQAGLIKANPSLPSGLWCSSTCGGLCPSPY